MCANVTVVMKIIWEALFFPLLPKKKLKRKGKVWIFGKEKYKHIFQWNRKDYILWQMILNVTNESFRRGKLPSVLLLTLKHIYWKFRIFVLASKDDLWGNWNGLVPKLLKIKSSFLHCCREPYFLNRLINNHRNVGTRIGILYLHNKLHQT